MTIETHLKYTWDHSLSRICVEDFPMISKSDASNINGGIKKSLEVTNVIKTFSSWST